MGRHKKIAQINEIQYFLIHFVILENLPIPISSTTVRIRYVITELLQSDLHKIIVSPQHLSADHIKVFLYQILRGECYLFYLYTTVLELARGKVLYVAQNTFHFQCNPHVELLSRRAVVSQQGQKHFIILFEYFIYFLSCKVQVVTRIQIFMLCCCYFKTIVFDKIEYNFSH